MPNIKSAKKRVLVNEKKTEQNKAIRSAVKTEIKKVELLIKENKLDTIKEALANAFAKIDSAASKNIYHKKNASNKKAKLAKKVDAALKAAGIVEEVKVEAPAVEAPAEEKKAPAKKPAAKKTTTTAAKKPAAKKAPAKKEADAE